MVCPIPCRSLPVLLQPLNGADPSVLEVEHISLHLYHLCSTTENKQITKQGKTESITIRGSDQPSWRGNRMGTEFRRHLVQSHHPWRRSRKGELWHWESWFSGHGGDESMAGLDGLKSSFPTLMILWLCEKGLREEVTALCNSAGHCTPSCLPWCQMPHTFKPTETDLFHKAIFSSSPPGTPQSPGYTRR